MLVANLVINTTLLLLIGESTLLNRSTVIGNVHSFLNSNWDVPQTEQLVKANDVSFGRCINRLIYMAHMAGAKSENDTSQINERNLAELCANMPQTDANLAKLMLGGDDESAAAGRLSYIESVNSFFWQENPPPRSNNNDNNNNNNKRKPKKKPVFCPCGNVTASANYYIQYLKTCASPFPFGKIIEVENEPDAELPTIGKFNVSAIAEFHIGMADAMHKEFGTDGRVVVAGPVGCTTQFQTSNRKTGETFWSWTRFWQPFFDQALSSLDAISVHLYDNLEATAVPQPLWNVRSIGSNVEAVMDLLHAYPNKILGKPKPIIVSEFGTSFAKWKDDHPPFAFTEYHCWTVLMAVNGKIFEFVDRQATLIKAVPFLVHDGSFWKAGRYPWQLVYNNNNSKSSNQSSWSWTPLALHYTLWNDVAGDRIYATSSNPNVQLLVARKNATSIVVVMNNLRDEPARATLSLGSAAEQQAWAGSGSVRVREYWEHTKSKIVLETEPAIASSGGGGAAAAVPSLVFLKPNECTKFVFIMRQTQQQEQEQEREQSWKKSLVASRSQSYSLSVMVPLVRRMSFTIPVSSPKKMESSTNTQQQQSQTKQVIRANVRLCGSVSNNVPTSSNATTAATDPTLTLTGRCAGTSYLPLPMAGYAVDVHSPNRMRCWNYNIPRNCTMDPQQQAGQAWHVAFSFPSAVVGDGKQFVTSVSSIVDSV